MLFNSYTFLIFLAVVLTVSRLRWSWTGKKAFLLLMSYAFYASWNPPFVALLWISTLVDWHIAAAIPKSRTPARKKALLACSLVVNLGLLAYFKYTHFLIGNIEAFLGSIGIAFHPQLPSIILPVGISFYTFQTLSYTLDVYRGQSKPWNSFLDYALYVTFFPQLVAGPIVRASEFLPQCVRPKRATGTQLGWGLTLLVIGLFNKTVIADYLMAPMVEVLFDGGAQAGLALAWAGVLAFAVQIYCDFAGYSMCAIGVALALGFEFPDNFRFPYAALGFSDFWRRWHISLSSWLRDYLYISLGGNRKGTYRTYANMMMTMLLGGLWHGASWNFVMWGGLHGGYLVGERMARRYVPDRPFWRRRPVRLALILLTFICVCFAWVYFRAPDFAVANRISAAMLGLSGIGTLFQNAAEAQTDMVLVRLGVVALVLLGHLYMRDRTLESVVQRIGWRACACATAAMLSCVLLCFSGDDRAFIYFQF